MTQFLCSEQETYLFDSALEDDREYPQASALVVWDSESLKKKKKR